MFECKYPGCLTGKKKMNKGKNMVVNTYKVFRFPKDDTYFSIWERYTGRKNLRNNANNHLCELHFEKCYFRPTKKSYTLTHDAVPTIDFKISEQTQTVITPNKGEHLIDITPRQTKLSFHSEVGGSDPFLNADISNLIEDNIENSKFESSKDVLKYTKSFLEDSNWGHVRKSDSLHKFAFFPHESENEQSVMSFTLDMSVDINGFGSKSMVTVHSLEGLV